MSRKKGRLLGLRDLVTRTYQDEGDTYVECPACFAVVTNLAGHRAVLHREVPK